MTLLARVQRGEVQISCILERNTQSHAETASLFATRIIAPNGREANNGIASIAQVEINQEHFPRKALMQETIFAYKRETRNE
jgi:hypothetical protein